jgi:hypothetical protein
MVSIDEPCAIIIIRPATSTRMFVGGVDVLHHVCVTTGLTVSVDVATVCGDAISAAIAVGEFVIVARDVTEQEPTLLANFCQLVALLYSTLVASLY